jgi:hypothetical protein
MYLLKTYRKYIWKDKERKNIFPKESKKSKREEKRARKYGVKTGVQDLEGYSIIYNQSN